MVVASLSFELGCENVNKRGPRKAKVKASHILPLYYQMKVSSVSSDMLKLLLALAMLPCTPEPVTEPVIEPVTEPATEPPGGHVCSYC